MDRTSDMHCLVCGGSVPSEERLRLGNPPLTLGERLILHGRCGSILSALLASSLDQWMRDHTVTRLPVYQMTGAVLAPRLRDMLLGICQGKSNAEIARDLDLSFGTVKNYIEDLFTELGVESRTQAAMLAVQEGWIAPKDIPHG